MKPLENQIFNFFAQLECKTEIVVSRGLSSLENGIDYFKVIVRNELAVFFAD